ncbi:MAG TPA: glucose 1-dehydrogenase [Candidatus Syntrophosphaera sp.]|nr:glucose 1-dehydrogenase [Candidatus Syntrophosphaera sp.]
MNRLKNKVALITGAAKGMGEAEARLFAEEGASLIITDIDYANLEKVASEIQASGTKVLALKHNVASEEEWKKVTEEAEIIFGKVDILVNNAGILSVSGVEETTMDIWNKVVSVNQTGTWLGMKYIVPLMRKAGGGSIINISSVYALIGTGTSAAYQSTKGAIRILSKTAAIEFAKDNIRVNTVFPGAIATSITETALDKPSKMEETVSDISQIIPMKRIGKPIEVAYGVLYFASDESSYTTGAELVIDGGWTIP